MDIRLDTPQTSLTGTTISGNLGADVVVLPNGQLELDNGLRTPIHLSLFCDRTADPSDDVPRALDEAIPDRGGYWADFLSPIPGDHWGSRIGQLLRQGAILDAETLAALRSYGLEALEWIRTLGIGTVEITTELLPEPGNLLFHVDVIDSLTGQERRYSFLWDAMAREGV